MLLRAQICFAEKGRLHCELSSAILYLKIGHWSGAVNEPLIKAIQILPDVVTFDLLDLVPGRFRILLSSKS